MRLRRCLLRGRRTALIPSQALVIVGEFIVNEVIHRVPQIDRSLGRVIPAVPPREIVVDKLVSFLTAQAITPKGVWLVALQLLKQLPTSATIADVPNEVVQPPNRALAAPVAKLHLLGSEII
jgi:hypothetical protein